MPNDFSVFSNDGKCPSGTLPSSDPHPPAKGRYKVVRSGSESFLYIPQIQELFYAPGEALEELDLADVEAPRIIELRALESAQTKELDRLKSARDLVDYMCNNRKTEDLPVFVKDSGKDGLKDLVVNIAQICNLACGYCYADNLNKAKKTMSIRVADAVIDRAMLLAPKGLNSVKFLGGEPTIAWDVAKYLMARFDEVASAKNCSSPIYVTVTNGTLLTDSIIEDMIKNRMYVMVSLDGPKNVHNENRPYLGGRGSYDKVIDGLKKMISSGLKPAVEAVFTKAHVDAGVTIVSLLEDFKSIGVREAQITIALGVWHELDTTAQVDQVIDDVTNAAAWSVKSFGTEDPFLLRGIQFVLTGFATKSRRDYVCGAGRTFMAVNYDGEAFPCYLMETRSTSYGFVDKRWNEDRFNSVGRSLQRNGKAHHPVCRECWANEICQSCLGSTFLLAPEIAKPPAWFCRLQKEVISVTLAEIGCLRTNGDWDLFLSNLERMTAYSTD